MWIATAPYSCWDRLCYCMAFELLYVILDTGLTDLILNFDLCKRDAFGEIEK